MKLNRLLTGLFLLSSFMATASALTVDEVIRLAEAGVGDGVMVEQVRASGTRFELTTDDILRLKAAHVADSVVLAMIETRKIPVPAVADPAEVAPIESAGIPPPDAHRPGGADGGLLPLPGNRRQGGLQLVNADERSYSFTFETGSRSIYVYYGEAGDPVMLSTGETRTLPVASGGWYIRWVGDPTSYRINVRAGETTGVTLVGTRVSGVSAVAVEIREVGGVETGGTLRKFSSRVTAWRYEEGDEPARAGPTSRPIYVAASPTIYVERTWVPTATCVRETSYDPFWGDYRSSTTCIGEYPVRMAGSSCGNVTRIERRRSSSSDWLPGGRTLVGAGLGAIIGHQYHERGKGAAIGAGAGYLLDQIFR